MGGIRQVTDLSCTAEPRLPEKVLFLLSVTRKWLISRAFRSTRSRPCPAHVIFCLVDHYEPGTGEVSADIEKGRVERLLTKWPKLADRHRDAFGNRPRISWFLPPHYHRRGNLKALVSLAERRYGEIELHLHHGKSAPDTAEHLAHTIRLCVTEYGRFGVFGNENGQKRYAFVHGDWALDNSRRNGRMCGVDNELQVLIDTGCYADFTFPSCNEANPSQINSIYYARGKPGRRKSYNRGVPAHMGRASDGDLLIVQGPLHPIFVNGWPSSLRVFGDDIAQGKPPTKKRIDLWVNTWIHIEGRTDWVFVKVHTHGAEDADVILGEDMDRALDYLEDRYNDGKKYVLHYASARELYNMIKAAEAGELGGPEHYRDYRIARPAYDSSPPVFEASEELRRAVYKTYSV